MGIIIAQIAYEDTTLTVRNTDINEFLAMAPWAWPIGMKVLKHAQKIYQSIV